MIRRFNMFFVLAALLCLLPITAHAAETVASGSCGTSVNWVLTDDGTLTISGVGKMVSYSDCQNYPWYNYRSQIQSVRVNEGVTSVSDFAFGALATAPYSISSLSLADSVTYIGERAFARVLKVSSLRLPSNLKTLGSYAFQYAQDLVSITIPSSVSSIDDRCFQGCTKLVSVVCLSTVPPSAGYNIFDYCNVLTRIVVPEGSVDAYKSAAGWSTYAGFISDGLLDPNVFTVLTSWADQHIYIDSGESVNLYFIADGVNGSVTIDWYASGQLIDSFPVNNWLDSDTVIGAYEYRPGADGSRLVYAVVSNSIGTNTETVTTPSCTIVIGQGTGSGSIDSDRFDQIDVQLTEVSDKIDGLSDQLDELQSGGSAGEDLSDRSDQLADDFAGIDEFEQSQMDILDSGMVQIKDSVSYTSFIPALAFVQRYADMTFDSIFDISIIFYLPMFLGLFFFLCNRIPNFARRAPSGSKGHKKG